MNIYISLLDTDVVVAVYGIFDVNADIERSRDFRRGCLTLNSGCMVLRLGDM